MSPFSLFHSKSLQRFARSLMRELKIAGDTREAEFDEAKQQIIFLENEKKIGFVNLAQLHEEFQNQVGAQKRSFVKNAVRSILSSHKEIPREFSDASPDLLLTVRNRSFFSAMEYQAWQSGDKEFTWPHIPLAEHLGVGIVYDLPESMMMIQQDHLSEWDSTFYEVYESALGNLSEIEATFGSLEDRLYVSDTQDNFDASRILMTDWIEQLQVKGLPVVMIPTRDKLLVTGSEDPKGLELMAQIAVESLAQPRSITGIAFCLNENEYTPWLPDSDSSMHSIFQHLHQESIASDYEAQKRMLEQNNSEDEDQIFVASHQLLSSSEGKSFSSFCVWPEDVNTLLPKTDSVVFAQRSLLDSDEIPIRYPWDVVVEVLKSNMVKQPLYPLRYLVSQFPTDEEMNEIKSRTTG